MGFVTFRYLESMFFPLIGVADLGSHCYTNDSRAGKETRKIEGLVIEKTIYIYPPFHSLSLFMLIVKIVLLFTGQPPSDKLPGQLNSIYANIPTPLGMEWVLEGKQARC